MSDHEQLPIDPDLSPDDPGEPSAGHRPVAGHGRFHRARDYPVLAAIALGGFIGATGRYELGLAWKTATGNIPWTTWVINTSGAFLLGVILTLILEHPRPNRLLRPFFCVGILGAWTTMSTFALDSDLLVREHHWAYALAYLVATVAAGLTMTWVGIALGRTIVKQRRKVAEWASR